MVGSGNDFTDSLVGLVKPLAIVRCGEGARSSARDSFGRGSRVLKLKVEEGVWELGKGVGDTHGSSFDDIHAVAPVG